MTAFSSNLRSLLVLLAGFTVAPGCGLIADLENSFDDGSVLSAFSTHHGTPKDGAFPMRDGPPRFVNDIGWEVLLDDAFITTVGLTMHACSNATTVPLQMYWGALPENLNDQDLETQPMGGVPLESGDWCGVTVHYGPFMPGGSEDYQMEDPMAVGTTFYVRGLATRGEEMIPFNVAVSRPLDVLIPLTDLDSGNPLQVTDQNNPDMTISKAYDKLFDGVDFATATQMEIEDIAMERLGQYTYVTLGTVIVP